MKNKKLVYIIIAVVLSLVAITITGFVLAEVSNNRSYEELNRTAVVLDPKKDANGNYTGEVEVLLQMNDGIRTEEQKPNDEGTIIEDAASVQSFQIGLDVGATIESENDISFEFNPDLEEKKENEENKIAGEVKLAKVTQEAIEDEQASSGENKVYKGERLNIYYVGTKDLNDTNSREMVSIGTLKINVPESNNNETVLVSPIKEATTASSTGHTETPIDVKSEDGITFIMNARDSEHEDDSGNTTGNETTGGNTTGDDNTTGGNTSSGNTAGDNNTTGGNTTGDDNTTGGNTSGGSTSGDNTTGGGSTSGNNGNGGSTGGSQNNGWSAKDDEKANGNFMNKIIDGIKTGANHSLTWVIIAIVVLTVVAIGIVKLKAQGKKSKHSKH